MAQRRDKVVTPIANPAAEHWLHELQDDLALIEAEHRDALHDNHPGARHRVTLLADRAITRRRQIAALGRQS